VGASAGDVRAGGAFYEMYAKDGELQLAVARARATVAKFAGFVKSLPVVGGPFEALTQKLAPLGNLAARTGGALKTAFLGFTGSLARARDLLKTVGAGLGAAGGAVAAPLLGLFKGATDRAADLQRLNLQLGVPVGVLNKLQYAADRAGVSLDEVMQDTTGRYASLIAQAPAIDPADARAAAEAQNALADATRAVQDALLPLVQIVTPVVKQFGEWVKRNAALVAVLVPVAGGLLAAGAAAGVAAVAISGLLTVGGLALKVLGAAAAVVTSPFTLAAVAVGGLVYALARYTETGQKATAQIKGGLAPALDEARGIFGALANAIQKGDLEGALDVAGGALELVWARLTKKLTDVWNDFKAGVGESLRDVFGGLGPAVEGALKLVGDAFRRLKTEVGDAVEGAKKLWDRLKAGAQQAWEYVTGLWDKFGPTILRVIEPVKPLLVGLFAPVIAAVKLVQALWDGLDKNIVVTVNRLAKTVAGAWEWIVASIEQALKRIAFEALKVVEKAATQAGALGVKIPGFDATAFAEQLSKAKAELEKGVDVEARVKLVTDKYDAVEAVLRAQQEAAKKARGDGRDADAKEAEARVKELEAKLGGAVERANVPRAPGEDKGGVLKPGLVPDVTTKGQFGAGNLAQSLGLADKAVQQTELLKQLNDTLKNNPAETARQLAPLVKPQTVR
jgi:hypothetical protein